jgi:hypothetical protein
MSLANRNVVRQSVSTAATEGENAFVSLLFENDRIKVYDFRLPPRQQHATILHRKPTIRWQVDAGQHRLKVENDAVSTSCEETVQDRHVWYVEPGTTWHLTNTNAKEEEYRQIVFELQSDSSKYSQAKINELFGNTKFSTDVGTCLKFENHLVRVWDFYLQPGQGGGQDTVHQHCLDYVFVNVAPSRLLGLHPETLSLENLLFDSVSEENQVTWTHIPELAVLDAVAFSHGGKNGYEDRPMREYLVELK